MRLTGERTTPHPWVNVIANASFGFHTSAEGASFTWSRNSRDFQLTPWTNDPVRNRPGEAIYIFDQASERTFSPIAAVVRDPSARYEARHGQGYSVFSVTRGKLVAELTQIVDPSDPVKMSRLVIRNGGPVPARLRVYAYAEWVLGTNRARSAPTIVPSLDQASGALLARNPYSLEFPDRVAFLAGDGGAQSVTCDRAEFIGNGSAEWPASVRAGASLSGAVEAGRDPCAAIARDIEVAPGGEASLTFLLGDAGSPEEASALVPGNIAPAISPSAWRRRGRTGTGSSARSKSRRRTRASTCWSTAGCPTRAWPAASARARPSTRRAAHSASATSCRTRWPSSCTIRRSPASRSSMRRRGSSRKATCSIGGCRAPAPACAR